MTINVIQNNFYKSIRQLAYKKLRLNYFVQCEGQEGIYYRKKPTLEKSFILHYLHKSR